MEIYNKVRWYLMLWLKGKKSATTFAIRMQIHYLKKYKHKKKESWMYWNNKCMSPWTK